jgi:hypothetical protein
MPVQRVRSVGELAERIARDPELEKKIKADPVRTIASLSTPLQTDVWIYRMVVVVLGLVVMGAMVGAILLAVRGGELPQFIVAVGSAAGGALTGLLAPSPAAPVERHRT